jgi:hypothetical protein
MLQRALSGCPGPKFDGPRSFYDRSLVCKACGVDAETTEISGAQFFSIERPVAGSHHEPSAIDAKMGGSDLMRSKLGTIRADAERMCDSERFNHVTVRTVRRPCVAGGHAQKNSASGVLDRTGASNLDAEGYGNPWLSAGL